MEIEFKRVGEFANIYIKGGILYSVYLPNTTIDLERAKKIVAAKMTLCTTDYPHLVDVRFVKSLSQEARSYFANSEEGNAYINAVAIVAESSISKLIGNMYLTLNTPRIPNKLFTDKAKALEWLLKYKS